MEHAVNNAILSFSLPCMHYTELLCPVLTPPENGQVFVNGQTVNSIATYFCEDGFVPELLVRSCLDNGEWSGFDPMCISMQQ